MESKVLLKAIENIHDPQSFTEKLFKRLRGSKCPFETKLMMMDLVSRLIGTHELILLPFYSYIQRYLNSPTHESITRILASFLQSCHSVVRYSFKLVKTIELVNYSLSLTRKHRYHLTS